MSEKRKEKLVKLLMSKRLKLKQIFQSVEGNLSYQNPVSGKVLSVVDSCKASQGSLIIK